MGCDDPLLECEIQYGIESIDLLLKQYGIYPVAKALNPLDDNDFLVIVSRLSGSLQGVTREKEALALKKALDTLDVDWPNLSSSARDRVFEASKRALYSPNRSDQAKLSSVLEDSSERTVKDSNSRATSLSGLSAVEPSLSEMNREAIIWASKGNVGYITDRYSVINEEFTRRAKTIVSSSLESGRSLSDTKDLLRSSLGSEVSLGKSSNYYDLIATNISNRSRTSSLVDMFDRAGFSSFRYTAVMDKRTSSICRTLHGKTFSVKSARDRMQKLFSSKPEDIEKITPFVSDRRDGSFAVGSSTFSEKAIVSSAEKQGITVPPLHPFCRSSIIPIS
jgi:SPP1 gp7 family putative phage head morphogenesis protein